MEQKIRRDRNMGENLRRLRAQSGLSQEKFYGCTYDDFFEGLDVHPDGDDA